MTTPATSEENAGCRALLRAQPVPAPGVVTLTTLSASLNDGVALAVSYIPDQLILTRAGFDSYVKARAAEPDTTPEALAARIAADIANELVPRWLRVTVNHQTGGAVNHSATVEDRQPGWDQSPPFKTP